MEDESKLQRRSLSRSRSRSPSAGRRSFSPRGKDRSPVHGIIIADLVVPIPALPAVAAFRRVHEADPHTTIGLEAHRAGVVGLYRDHEVHVSRSENVESGEVVEANIMVTGNGKSKGCGVVEYRYPDDAQRAIRTLHNTHFMGRPVLVREDREEPGKDPRQAGDGCQLFIGNLPYSASWQDMKDLFRKAGRVTHTDVLQDSGTRRSRGQGIVIYGDSRDAHKAIEMFDGYEWLGRRLEVREDRYVGSSRPPPPLPPTGGDNYRSSGGGDPHPHYGGGRYEAPPPSHAAPYSNIHAAPAPAPYIQPERAPFNQAMIPPPIPNPNVGGPGSDMPRSGEHQVHVGNLPFSTTWQDLIDLFRHSGPVVRAETLMSNGRPKGAGLVRFEDASACERAIAKFHGYMYGGRPLDVRMDHVVAPNNGSSVAKVVKRHLVTQRDSDDSEQVEAGQADLAEHQSDQKRNDDSEFIHSTIRNAYKLPGGSIVDGIYKWTANVESERKQRLQRSHFAEFLCLYGHFGGEDLSDDDEPESNSDEDEEAVIGYGSSVLNEASSSKPAALRRPSQFTRNTDHDRLAIASTSRRRSLETSPLLPRTRNNTAVQGTATPAKAVFLLLKSFVTTGIMFLPKAFYNGGLLFSILGMIFIAAVSLYSFLSLVETRNAVPAGFGDMGGVLFGSKMRMAVLVCITLSQIGFVCAYMGFVAENLQSLILTFSKCRVVIPLHVLILAQCFVFIPLAMIRKIQRLSVFALIADIFIVIGLIYLYYYDFFNLATTGIAEITLWNADRFPLFIGTTIFTYEGIGLVIPITESMKEPERLPQVLWRTMAFITLLFTTMGAFSYMSFGDNVQTIVLLNLPAKDPGVSTIIALYSLAICLSIPLQLFPAIRIMENGLFTTRSGKNNAVVKWEKNVFRVAVVFVCAWVSIVGSKDKLDKFVALVGTLFCAPLCFFFPPLFHLKAAAKSYLRKVADILVMLFGCLCMIYGTAMVLIQWNSSDAVDPIKRCISRSM
ncbi:unnamed protein product [Umbelopsis vinacea]